MSNIHRGENHIYVSNLREAKAHEFGILMDVIHRLCCAWAYDNTRGRLAELTFTTVWDIGPRLVTVGLYRAYGSGPEDWNIDRSHAAPNGPGPVYVELLEADVDHQKACTEFQAWCLNAVTEDTYVSLRIEGTNNNA